MRRYANLSGNSGILGYEIHEDSIVIAFADGEDYVYDSKKPGVVHVDEMKRLAVSGRGLCTYINQFVRGNFARKL